MEGVVKLFSTIKEIKRKIYLVTYLTILVMLTRPNAIFFLQSEPNYKSMQ